MNRNILKKNPDKIDPNQAKRLTKYWGDDSWADIAYVSTQNLFGFLDKVDNMSIVNAFRKRLKEIAGFAYVPEPIPMRNSKGAVVYYLFFASPKPVAAKIVEYIFKKYRNRLDGTYGL